MCEGLMTGGNVLRSISEFVVDSSPPALARAKAVDALCDTVGVMLAGAAEPAAQITRDTIPTKFDGVCTILGTRCRSDPDEAAMANGVAAHSLDYDDFCVVSMSHASCVLVPAALAAAEFVGASGRTLLDAYVVGFELECRLGRVMNPRHYEHGWHSTSTLGTLGAAAAAARVLKLTDSVTRNALAIAASLACGLKQNFGTMTKPLHAGIAARNGIMAARLASKGLSASEDALTGSQGFLTVMQSQRPNSALVEAVADLGSRWDICDSGIVVKLYASCGATHPALDALLTLANRYSLSAEDIDTIHIEVDSSTPQILIYDRPSTALEGKFSMPFCAAAVAVFGRPTIDTFCPERLADRRVQRLIPRVTLEANPDFDSAPPLSQARVTVRLLDGRSLTERADGARGYPGRLTQGELTAKFLSCAEIVMPHELATEALAAIRSVDSTEDISTMTKRCVSVTQTKH